MKNKLMRAATLLLVLTLMTSCFVGSTFAKYTTQVTGEDTARIAKFGVVLTADADIFDPSYTGTNGVSVKASPTADVIAPGTTGTATIFTIAGAPEVDVDVVATLGAYTIATLPVGNYKNYTNLNNSTPYNLASDYKPVKWTLTKTSGDPATTTTVVDAKNLDQVQAYLTSISKHYDVDAAEFASVVGTYELTWNWAFGVDDVADTYMGQVAAGVESAPSGYVANESFDFSLQVTQVD